MLAAVALQIDQLSVFAVGHAVKLRPPFAPHPLIALGFVENAVLKAEVAKSPVMPAVAGVVQLLAGTAAVGRVITMFTIDTEGQLWPVDSHT